MPDVWDWSIAWELLPILLKALWVTVLATLGGTALALVLGLVLAGLRSLHNAWIAQPVGWLIEFIRSTPLLVQLALVYFAVMPSLGIDMPPLLVGILCLGVHYACYMSEIYRAGLEAVPAGQYEAAHALGLNSWQRFRHIVVPQAIPRAIPGLGNRMIAMFKETPLLQVITVNELLRAAGNYGAANFRSMEPYTLVGVFFLIISLLAALLVRAVQAQLPVRHA